MSHGYGKGIELMHVVREALECDAICLSQMDPERHGYTVLAQAGYSQGLLDFLNRDFVDTDASIGYLTGQRRPFGTWGDSPVDYRTSANARAHFLPAGYRDGITIFLQNGHGVRTGAIHGNWKTPRSLPRSLTQVLAGLRPIIGDEIDWWNTLPAGPEETRAMFLLDRAGARIDPRRDGDDANTEDGETWDGLDLRVSQDVLLRLGQRQVQGYARVNRTGWRFIRIVATADGAMASVAPAEPDFGLTERELQMLTLLNRGASNASMAKLLTISERTIAHHIEHVLRKLGVDNRTSAAVLAETRQLKCLRTLLKR